jgi:hypothetical protein
MTLEEYFAFAGAEAERPYFEFMELEILDSLQEGNGLRIEEEDLDSLPKEYVNIRIYRADRDALAARMKYGETMADADPCADRQRGSTLEAVTVAKLVDSIPVTAQEELETYLNEDLRGAVVTDTVPIVDEDGKIFLAEIILRLKDGREVAIVPEMRGKSPWLSLEIHDGQDWRNMSVAEDYAEELEELTAAPWRPEPDTPEGARL